MSPEDRAFVVMADPAGRESVLAQGGAQSILDAAYGSEVAQLEAPLQPVYDAFELGVSVASPHVDLAGTMQDAGGQRTVVQLQAQGLHRDRVVADAFWRGAIVARASIQRAPVIRTRSSAQAKTLDLQVEIGEPAPSAAASEPIPLPIAAAIVVRRAGESLAQLIARGRDARAALLQRGEAARARSGYALAHPIVIAALLSNEFLSDPDWPDVGPPGPDTPADRRQHLRNLLAPQGVALLTL